MLGHRAERMADHQQSEAVLVSGELNPLWKTSLNGRRPQGRPSQATGQYSIPIPLETWLTDGPIVRKELSFQ